MSAIVVMAFLLNISIIDIFVIQRLISSHSYCVAAGNPSIPPWTHHC